MYIEISCFMYFASSFLPVTCWALLDQRSIRDRWTPADMLKRQRERKLSILSKFIKNVMAWLDAADDMITCFTTSLLEATWAQQPHGWPVRCGRACMCLLFGMHMVKRVEGGPEKGIASNPNGSLLCRRPMHTQIYYIPFNDYFRNSTGQASNLFASFEW